MMLHRVLNAGIGGILDRGRQELSRALERMAFAVENESAALMDSKNYRFPLIANATETIEGDEAIEMARRAWEGFVKSGDQHFFAGAWDKNTATVIGRDSPESMDQAIAAADAVIRGQFDLLGYRGLSFGHPVDWHLDPVSGQRAPLTHWTLLDPLDADAVGDAKVIWELNRHQWLVTLGQAYCFTHKEEYAHAAARLIGCWMQYNPPGMGINWASSLEVALRLISWCWALALFRQSPVMTQGVGANMSAWIRIHALHVEKYLSRYFSPNTHLTGEALGLFYAGVLFREFREARRWMRIGSRLLITQLQRQVLGDGVYFEQSTCYQRYTIEIYLHFLVLSARNGRMPEDSVVKQIESLLDFLVNIRRPDGSMPQIGDADGGQLLRLSYRQPDDFRGVFAVAGAVFGRADYAWAAESASVETSWLLGQPGSSKLASLKPAPPAGMPSRLYRDGGYAVMRSDWGPRAHQLIFDVGPLGCPLSGGHGHADLLSVQCSAFGEAQLIDSGTGSYVRQSGWRDYFRSTFAHNTVTVDSYNQAESTGEFSWNSRPEGRLRRWISNARFDFVDAEHEAYCHLADPVVHRRRVYFKKPHFWIMVDDVIGSDIHRVDLRFQFASSFIDQHSKNRFISHGIHGGLLVHSFSTNVLQTECFKGASDSMQGWISRDYGSREQASSLVFTAVNKLPVRIVTFIIPVLENEINIPTIELIAANTDSWKFSMDHGEEIIHVDDLDISVWQHTQIGNIPA